MHEFVVVVFPDAAMTRRASDAIKKLHWEGRIKMYGAALVARDSAGKLSTQQVIKRGHAATAVGALIGGLAGLPFGPLAMAILAAGGASIGYSAELLHEGDAAKFVQKTSRDLAPGEAVFVAEIAQDGVKGFATLMGRLGGTVIRSTSVRGTASQ
jgi:uncharacterized membrane protein